jgi:hypothetical protein
MTFGQIKFFAWQFLKGRGIPVFKDRRINREIDRHVDRILAAKTKARK